MPMTNAQREAATAAALVAGAQQGDAAAFEALVRRYRKRIFALALHLCGCESDADDITQDVFVRAYHALDRFEGRSEFFTWVYRMTVNRAIDARRARARRSESSFEDHLTSEPRRAGLEDPRIERAVEADAGGDPRRAAELRQTYARVVRALDALPVEMRTTVVLVALQGLSNAEAAVVQKCSRGTIAWRLHEARARIDASLRRPIDRAPERDGRVRSLSRHLAALLASAGLPSPELT
jgi:RNA polymerase sigma-70 factor (ECF subfamily)